MSANGTVRVVDAAGKALLEQKVEQGDIFGWSAVLADTQAQSTVVATEPSRALVIEGTHLRAALKEDHALAASLYPRVLKAVARRLRATRLQLLDLFAR